MDVDRTLSPEEAWLHADVCLRGPALWRDERKRPSWMKRGTLPQPSKFWYREPGLWLPLSCAIAVDATASSGLLSTSPGTYSHTCSGSDRLLLVSVFGDVNNDSITGVTYNGAALTRMGLAIASSAARYHYLYAMVSPDTGTNTVSVAFSTGLAGACSASYTGVVGTAVSAPDATGTNTALAAVNAPLELTLTLVASNCWMAMTAGASAQPVELGNGNTTIRQFWTLNNNMALLDSNGAQSSGAFALGMFTTTLADKEVVGMSFAPGTGGGGGGATWPGYQAPFGWH